MIKRFDDGLLYVVCDRCERHACTHSIKMFGLSLPKGWKEVIVQSKSKEGTNQIDGRQHLCIKCS